MDMIQFTVPGEPQGKARPRFNGKTKCTYTPQSTKDYEELVRTCYIQKYGVQPLAMEEPLVARITAYFSVPKSASNKKRDLMLKGEIRPTKKPDADNIEKAVFDALNGLAYKDDSQIVNAEINKCYHEHGSVEVYISRIGGK